MNPNPDYIEAIKAKLDAMNKVAGVDPSNKLSTDRFMVRQELKIQWTGLDRQPSNI
jgi:hypothetical protein